MQAAIFDMDGVLVDNNQYHKKSWLLFLESFGYHLTDEQLNQHVYGKINEDILNYVFPEPLDDQRIRELSYQKEELYREIYQEHIEAPPGLVNLLEALQSKMPLGIATSAPPQNLDFVLDTLHIRQFFSTLVHGEMVKQGKPHPEIYLKAAHQLNVEPQGCVVFEDSLAGIESAQHAGMKVVAITSTYPADQLNHADQVIATFGQFEMELLNPEPQLNS